MVQAEIEALNQQGTFRNQTLDGQLIETHISWIILTQKFAFKIKKPLKLSFLDYSTLAKRKGFCEKEIRLNRRFSKIYLATLPIVRSQDKWLLGEAKGTVTEYAVQMKRMDPDKQMDVLLQKGKVSETNIQPLADSITQFHQLAEKVFTPFQLSQAKELFNDIQQLGSFVDGLFGNPYSEFIESAIQWSDEFLSLHQNRLKDRIELGFKRDLHGDLHSGNIFLYPKPVLFDCIEFNDSWREIDLLYEIAFLCMDLEYYGQKSLSELLLKAYTDKIECLESEEDLKIFLYFKCLRANIRAKVHAISALNSRNSESQKEHVLASIKYLNLMKTYQKN